MAKDYNSEGLSGLLSATMAQYSAIQSADNAVDSKANNLMAAALVIVPLLGTQLTDGDGNWHWLTVVSMLVMVGTTLMVLYLTRSRRYASAVVDLRVHQSYFVMDSVILLAQLIEDTNLANSENTVILEDKQRFFRYVLAIFLLGFAFGIVSLFLID